MAQMMPLMIVGLGMMCLSSSVGAALMMGGDGDGVGSILGPSPGPSLGPSGDSGADNQESEDENVPNVLTDPVGTPIQCNANDVGSGVNVAVYRYMGGDELRHYPNPPIATSWDPDWATTFKKIDCEGLIEGDKMPVKP